MEPLYEKSLQSAECIRAHTPLLRTNRHAESLLRAGS